MREREREISEESTEKVMCASCKTRVKSCGVTKRTCLVSRALV